MPASFSNSQNSHAAAPGPDTQALLEQCNIRDLFPTGVPPPFSQEEIDSLDKQQMYALLSSMASQPYQTAASPSKVNLSATKPFELSPFPDYKIADHGSYNWLTATLTVDSELLQNQLAQGGCTDSETDHAWADSGSEKVPSESCSEMDSEPEVDSESGGVDSESRELLDTHNPSPSAGGRPETAVTLAPVGDVDRSQRLAPSWVSDPDRALLRRHMGITADLDEKTQEQQSLGVRYDVRQKAGIDFSKTWT